MKCEPVAGIQETQASLPVLSVTHHVTFNGPSG